MSIAFLKTALRFALNTKPKSQSSCKNGIFCRLLQNLAAISHLLPTSIWPEPM